MTEEKIKIIAVRCEKCNELMYCFESGINDIPNTRHEVYGHDYKNKCKNRVRIWFIGEF